VPHAHADQVQGAEVQGPAACDEQAHPRDTLPRRHVEPALRVAGKQPQERDHHDVRSEDLAERLLPSWPVLKHSRPSQPAIQHRRVVPGADAIVEGEQRVQAVVTNTKSGHFRPPPASAKLIRTICRDTLGLADL